VITKASLALAKALRPKVMSAVDLARKLGISKQTVSDWVAHRSRPEPERMAQLEELLGIPMREWTEEAEESGGTGTEG